MNILLRKFTNTLMIIGFAIAMTVSLPFDGFARGGHKMRSHHGGHHSAKFHGHRHGGRHHHGGGHHNHHHGGGHKHHHHHGHDRWHNHHHHYGRWVGAAVGAMAVGSIVYSLPSTCVRVNRAGVVYKRCGDTWYEPRYQGSNVVYVVVNAP